MLGSPSRGSRQFRVAARAGTVAVGGTDRIERERLTEWRPYGRRTMQIALTDHQCRQLAPRETGYSDGAMTHEQILQCWFEPATRPLNERSGHDQGDPATGNRHGG